MYRNNAVITRFLPFLENDNGDGNGSGSGNGSDDGSDDGAGDGDDSSASDTPDPVLGGGSGDNTDDSADGDDGADSNPSGDGDGDADGDDTDADDQVPEGDYEFEMPDGVELDEAMVTTMSPVFKELGITQGQANKLVEAYTEQMQTQAGELAQSHVDRIQKWTDDAQADKEIGGENWDGTVKKANAVLDKLGTPELAAALAETGMSNHPEMIRFVSRVGTAFGDDSFELGDNVDKEDVSTEEGWYGNTTPNTKKG